MSPGTSTDDVIPFVADDGRVGNVVHVIRSHSEDTVPSAPSRGPVLLVPGAGVRANIFRAPVDVTVVDALLDDGFDVWLEDWRARIGFSRYQGAPHHAAARAHPELLPEGTPIVPNGVSLHPVVPQLPPWKLNWFHNPLRALTRYLDPHW